MKNNGKLQYNILSHVQWKNEDWATWSIKFLARESLCGYRDIYNGNAVIPDEHDTLDPVDDKSKIQMRKKNEMAYCEILLSMKDTKFITCISDAKSKLLPSGDVNLAWIKLKEIFEPKDAATKLMLKRKFSNSKMESDDDPDEWIIKLEMMRRHLEMDFKSTMTDEDFVIHIV